MDLALTSINAASSLEPGVWNDFLSNGEGINAYEDLRSLFFDGDASLSGVVQVRRGVLQSNTLALEGRRGTLLTKGVLELDTLSGRGFLSDTPLRVELYRAEDRELVEQILLLQGSSGQSRGVGDWALASAIRNLPDRAGQPVCPTDPIHGSDQRSPMRHSALLPVAADRPKTRVQAI